MKSILLVEDEEDIRESLHTAKFHIRNILRKLNASNRCHALAVAAEKRLIKI